MRNAGAERVGASRLQAEVVREDALADEPVSRVSRMPAATKAADRPG